MADSVQVLADPKTGLLHLSGRPPGSPQDCLLSTLDIDQARALALQLIQACTTHPDPQLRAKALEHWSLQLGYAAPTPEGRVSLEYRFGDSSLILQMEMDKAQAQHLAGKITAAGSRPLQ